MDLENLGKVSVSSEVIAKIAGLAAMEIDGVVGMKHTVAGGLAQMFGKKDNSSGVGVEISEDQVNIGMNLIVKYGAPIPEVSWRVQQNVREAVEKMTGKTVIGVDVNISDVEFEETKEE